MPGKEVQISPFTKGDEEQKREGMKGVLEEDYNQAALLLQDWLENKWSTGEEAEVHTYYTFSYYPYVLILSQRSVWKLNSIMYMKSL